MNLSNQTTVLAPSVLHLDLYKKILDTQGSSLNINVMSLEAYLASRLTRSKTPVLSTLYAYKEALEDLDENNLFYSSRQDYDFLKACYDFMILAALYDITQFPQDSRREQDLYAVIRRLQPIELWVSEAKRLPFEDAKDLRILNTENSFLRQYWVDLLVQKGAKLIESQNHKRTYYWSCSNARKEMEVCADAIVANDLKADDVMVALADDSQKYVLMQAFESRGIPYTFAKSDSSRRIIEQWRSALNYVMDKSDANLMKLLEVLFAQNAYDLRRYIDLFGDAATSIQNMVYKPNGLISEETFVSLQELEVNISPWRAILEQIKTWQIDSIDQIGAVIMEQTPAPTQDDVNAFEGVMNLISAVRFYLHKPEDLSLLITALDTLQPSRALSSRKGVLIAGRDQISSLYSNVFYIGADAAHFPGSQAFGGIFDEDYLSRLPFPDLEWRTSRSFEQLKSVLMEPESLFILTPQADYTGKSIENSHELNMWLGMLPKFRQAAEPSSDPKPSFSLSGMHGKDLFSTKDGYLQAGVRSLHTFEECALRNLLQFGLCLRKPPASSDLFKIRGDLIARIMESGFKCYGLSYAELSREQIRALVDDDFAFALELFPNRKAELSTLAAQSAERVARLFESLKPASSELNLDVVESDYRVSIHKDFEGIPMNIEGSIALGSSSQAVFNLVSRTDDGFVGEALPKATLNLRLQPKAVGREAMSVRYNAGAAPAVVLPIHEKEALEKRNEDFFKGALSAQNLDGQDGALAARLLKKVPSYSDREKKIDAQAQELAQSLNENNFKPLHKPEACAHCSFKAICRNAAIERS